MPDRSTLTRHLSWVLCLSVVFGILSTPTAAKNIATPNSSVRTIENLTSSYDPMIDGFSFTNFTSADGTALTSVEMRRLFGNGVCAQTPDKDGACKLTPAAESWERWINSVAYLGLCQGVAMLSVAIHNGEIDQNDFGAFLPIDLEVTNNDPLRREIAYWYARGFTMPARSDVVKSSPNDALQALYDTMSASDKAPGVLRFRKLNGDGGHVVVPFAITETISGSGVFDVSVYDPNYPFDSRTITFDTKANTWFYSPESDKTEDDYNGTATSQSIGFMSFESQKKPQICSFCTPPAGLAQFSNDFAFQSGFSFGTPPRSTDLSLPPVISGYPAQAIKINFSFDSNPLKSWLNPAQKYFTQNGEQAVTYVITGTGSITTATPIDFRHMGHGYTFNAYDLTLSAGEVDTFEVGVGGTAITYTTSSGAAPTFSVGFETTAADYDFQLGNFDFVADDALTFETDEPNKVVSVAYNTAVLTEVVTFDFLMERIGDTSSEIFQSPEEGITLGNDQILLIDFFDWDGNGKPLSMGYDANFNGILDPDEIFTIADVGNGNQVWLPLVR